MLMNMQQGVTKVYIPSLAKSWRGQELQNLAHFKFSFDHSNLVEYPLKPHEI